MKIDIAKLIGEQKDNTASSVAALTLAALKEIKSRNWDAWHRLLDHDDDYLMISLIEYLESLRK